MREAFCQLREGIMDTDKWIEAAARGDVAVLEALLSTGFNVHTRAVTSETALMRAAANGHAPAVEMLLEWGAPINAWRQDGLTALSLAAYYGHAEVISLLLRAGANLHVVDDAGLTAKGWAAAKGYHEVVELLQHAEAGGTTRAVRRPAKAAAVATAGPHSQPASFQRSEKPAAAPSARTQMHGPAPAAAASAPGLTREADLLRARAAGGRELQTDQQESKAAQQSYGRRRNDAPRRDLPPTPAAQRSMAPAAATSVARQANQTARPLLFASALILFAVVGCSTYLVARGTKSDLRITQSDTAGARPGARPAALAGAPNTISPNTISIAAPARPAAPQASPVATAGSGSADVATQVGLVRAPVERVPRELRKGVAKDLAPSDGIEQTPNSAPPRALGVASRDSGNRVTGNTDPVLVSETRPNVQPTPTIEPSAKAAEPSAKSAQGERAAARRGESAEARAVVPPAPAADIQVKAPTKKVIPWP